MESVITVIMISIGVVLLLVFQGMVLASLNKESEESGHQPGTRNHMSILDIVKKYITKNILG
jgi:hypothetical protein